MSASTFEVVVVQSRVGEGALLAARIGAMHDCRVRMRLKPLEHALERPLPGAHLRCLKAGSGSSPAGRTLRHTNLSRSKATAYEENRPNNVRAAGRPATARTYTEMVRRTPQRWAYIRELGRRIRMDPSYGRSRTLEHGPHGILGPHRHPARLLAWDVRIYVGNFVKSVFDWVGAGEQGAVPGCRGSAWPPGLDASDAR